MNPLYIFAFNNPTDSVDWARWNNPSGLIKTEEPRWISSAPDHTFWNQNFPYQLIVLEKIGESYSVYENVKEVSLGPERGVFTLPVNPTDLTIDTPFAINTSITSTGVIEEHNGAPVRNISISGNTGIMPLRPPTDTYPQESGVFGGTVAAAKNVAKSVTRFVEGSSSLINETEKDFTEGSGYYQFHLLRKFLEDYAYAKKTENGKKLRLAFANWKDGDVYLVTPVSFRMNKNAGKALLYNYNIQFKAWAKIKLDAQVDTSYYIPRKSNWAKDTLDKVLQAQEIIHNAQATVNAAVADVSNIAEIARQVAVTVKQALGVVNSVVDLPNVLADMIADVIEEYLSIADNVKKIGETAEKSSKAYDRLKKRLGKSPEKKSQEGPSLTGNASQGMKAGSSVKSDRTGQSNVGIMPWTASKINLSDLNIPSKVTQQINKELSKVPTKKEWEAYKDQIDKQARIYAESVGVGSAQYREIYGGLTEAPATKNSPSMDDWNFLFALNNISSALSIVIKNTDTAPNQMVTSMEYMAGLARASGIAFRVPTSKFAVPMPYGVTLEKLSQTYLGTPDRWHEIASLNGLREPYIDEEGFYLTLLSNGVGNQLVVQYTENLYIGQPVWIQSNVAKRVKRYITKLEKLSDRLTVSVSGDPDMDQFTTMAQAKIRAFLPDTVNSLQMIYIPSDKPSTDNGFSTDKVATDKEAQHFLNIGGIDLKLKENMDLAITDDGDCPFSVGFSNLIQRLKIGLSTPLGSLLRHPDYGTPLLLGQSIADVDVKQIKKSIEDFIALDPAFGGVNNVSVKIDGPVATIGISVGIRGIGDNIPIYLKLE